MFQTPFRNSLKQFRNSFTHVSQRFKRVVNKSQTNIENNCKYVSSDLKPFQTTQAVSKTSDKHLPNSSKTALNQYKPITTHLKHISIRYVSTRFEKKKEKK